MPCDMPPPTTPEAVNISISLVAYLPSPHECFGYLRASQMTLDVYLSNWGPPFRTTCCKPFNQVVRTHKYITTSSYCAGNVQLTSESVFVCFSAGIC